MKTIPLYKTRVVYSPHFARMLWICKMGAVVYKSVPTIVFPSLICHSATFCSISLKTKEMRVADGRRYLSPSATRLPPDSWMQFVRKL